MKQLLLILYLLTQFSAIQSQNYQIELGYSSISHPRIDYRSQRVIEFSVFRKFKFKDSRLNSFLGFGYNFDHNTPDCFERFDPTQIAREVPIWPYNFNESNCELKFQERTHIFSVPIGISYSLFKTKKYNIDIQFMNRVHFFDYLNRSFQDENQVRTEQEIAGRSQSRFFDDLFLFLVSGFNITLS